MHTMEFPDLFIQLLMGYITSVSYSLLLQGRPFGHIVPSRGLRQGDPRSSYLFLMLAKGFSALLQKTDCVSLRCFYCLLCTVY